jgi:predicted metalloprotease with PDZ domain
MAFDMRKVPTLFAIIADFHNDYHTARDVSSKINRVDAVHTVHLFHDIGFAAAQRTEPWEYQRRRPRRSARRGGNTPRRVSLKVTLGIMPGSYGADEEGVLVGGVTADGCADKAGIKEGDRLMTWNGKKIGNIRDWMMLMMKHKPGDKVKVGIDRKGKKLTKTVKLDARQ